MLIFGHLVAGLQVGLCFVGDGYIGKLFAFLVGCKGFQELENGLVGDFWRCLNQMAGDLANRVDQMKLSLHEHFCPKVAKSLALVDLDQRL